MRRCYAVVTVNTQITANWYLTVSQALRVIVTSL